MQAITDQCRRAAVQVGDLALEQEMDVTIARDVAGTAGARSHGAQRLLHRSEDGRVLTHAEVVVRTPNGHLGADAVIKGTRKTTATPLEIGKDAIAPLGKQPLQALFEKAFVVHHDCTRLTLSVAPKVQSALRNATRSVFCCSVKSRSKRRL